MMPSQKFELSDISGQRYTSETNLTMNQDKKAGCYVTSVVGVVLAFLVIVLAVAVGLIVYFAAGSKDIVCNCGPAAGGGTPSSSAVSQCVKLAEEGNTEICSKCESIKTTATPTGEPTTGSSAPQSTSSPPKVTDVRLPTSLNPLHYDVEIQPYMHHNDAKDFTFKGFVRVVVECKAATDNVTLHSNVLTVDPSSILFRGVNTGQADPSYTGWEVDEARQFFIIKVNKNMQVGKQYVVEMNFTSPLKDDLKGLYYSSYTRNNKTIYLATTQFQPTDARKTFPCMDEPALKATFNITLVRPSHLMSISNMPIQDASRTWVEDGQTYVADVYQESPKMPTYLLAFIICDFDYTQATTKNNVTYRALARPEAKESTRYALQAGVNILTYFEDYFKIKFPLPKQDMIAIPDFAAGAMENWGLITYRETAMLFEPGVSNERNKERVATVVSHELAHQWFGDLVTPSWWDDLWLNEGFASFVEYMGVDHIHPEWDMFDSFVTSEVQDVFDFDGLISSHPIYVPVAHPDEINEIFDRISYGKGASIIRMMRHFLGYETFRNGLVRYLNESAYGDAFHDDLWRALTEQARSEGKNLDVKSIMDTWTLQMNYPVVLVSRDFNDDKTIHVRQSRYLRDRSAKDPGKFESDFGYKWTIPLTFTSSEEKDFNKTSEDVKWMYHSQAQATFTFDSNQLPAASDRNGWILANINQNGFYRVNYQMGNWQNLVNQLKNDHTVIPVTNRAQITNDAWNLAKSDDLDLNVALNIAEYLERELDYIPWSAANKELGYVQTMLSLTPLYGPMQKFLAKSVKRAYSQLGLNNTGSRHTETYGRVLVASIACSTGNENCTQEASRQYAQWMHSPDRNPIDVNLKSLVYCNAVKHGGWDEWKFALDMYLASSVASEKVKLLYAMSCSIEPWILNNYLYKILESDSVIRKQDALSVINYISGNTIGRPLAWDFFRGHYDTLKAQFGNSFFAWTRLIGSVTSAFNTQYELEEIVSLMQSKSANLGTGKRAFEQAIEKTQSNIRWMAKNVPVITPWLQAGGYTS